jgi:hypothetical protein
LMRMTEPIDRSPRGEREGVLLFRPLDAEMTSSPPRTFCCHFELVKTFLIGVNGLGSRTAPFSRS